jgi:hypothetical protein
MYDRHIKDRDARWNNGGRDDYLTNHMRDVPYPPDPNKP